MIFQTKSRHLVAALQRLEERLKTPFTAHPMLLFLPVGMMCILLIYVSLETNPRLGFPAKPLQIPFSNGESKPYPIRFSIAPSSGGVVLVTNSGASFEFSQDNQDDLRRFSDRLKEDFKAVITDAALANRMDDTSSFVVLSVDEKLTYSHIRPIIYALAEAGVTRYGFEGRILRE